MVQVPTGRLLEGVGDSQRRSLIEGSPHDLEADWRAGLADEHGSEMAGTPSTS